jgi:hypothetical protein
MLWELRGRSGNPLTCVLHASPRGYRVVVALGDTQLLTDSFGAEENALEQGGFLLRDFRQEGWTEVYRSEKITRGS